ncbi:MAG: hypothetical protein D6826_10685, partial [Alphaproteobacteria bacterium]
MADIFKEVDEELRRESLEKIWKKYGAWIIAAAVALILAVAGYQAWQAYDLNRRQKLSEQFEAALVAIQSGDT